MIDSTKYGVADSDQFPYIEKKEHAPTQTSHRFLS